MKRIIYIYSTLIFMGLLFSCEEDDSTGYSNLTPSNPTVSVSVSGTSLVEQATEIPFTVSLSEKQIVDVEVYITQTGGDAELGTDFTIPSKIVIPSDRTSASGTISILADDVFEETETFSLTFGGSGTANAAITPVTEDFELINVTSDMMVTNLSWTTDVATSIGKEMEPEEVVDFRLLIVDKVDSSIIEAIDGAAFEEYKNFNSLADGGYLVAADIFSTIDAGDLNEDVTIDLQLDFFQTGLIDSTLSFPGATLNVGTCPGRRIYLAEVTKVGDTYTINEGFSIVEKFDLALLPGQYIGDDANLDLYGASFKAGVTITSSGGQYFIDGLNTEFMTKFWGEEIVSKVPVQIVLSDDKKSFTIAEQYYMTTLFEGAQYNYTIYGSGEITDVCTPKITVEYEMSQDGFLVAKWLKDNGYLSKDMFTANLIK